MWSHPKQKGFFIGSYDFEKKSGKRIFELLGGVSKRKRFKFVNGPTEAKEKGWTKVK